MENSEILREMDVSSEFGLIENHIFTILCVKDNISLLADGLALKEDNESCNALMLCVNSLGEAVRELSECIDAIDMKINRRNKEKVSDSVI